MVKGITEKTMEKDIIHPKKDRKDTDTGANPNLFGVLPPLPYNHPDGGSVQPEVLPYLVFQIPLVGEVKKLLVVDKGDKGWGPGGGLGHIVDAQPFSLVGGGLNLGGGVGQHIVEPPGGFCALTYSTVSNSLSSRCPVLAEINTKGT